MQAIKHVRGAMWTPPRRAAVPQAWTVSARGTRTTPGPSGLTDSRVALITGGNTGIGYETAKSLAQQGYYVVLGCRDEAKGRAARERIREAVPKCRGIEVVTFDLADLESVRSWALRAQDVGTPLDVLINNAGVMATPESYTAQGHELQFGVNHLGHFLLTQMLLPLLTANKEKEARIINVSSAAHFFGDIDFGEIQGSRGKAYDRWRAYNQSKLANVMFTYELARRLGPDSNVTVNTLHPGVVASELGRYILPSVPPILAKLASNFVLTPEQGAKTSIYLASSREVQGMTGLYWDKCKSVKSSRLSYDTIKASRLWDVSMELCNLNVTRGSAFV